MAGAATPQFTCREESAAASWSVAKIQCRVVLTLPTGSASAATNICQSSRLAVPSNTSTDNAIRCDGRARHSAPQHNGKDHCEPMRFNKPDTRMWRVRENAALRAGSEVDAAKIE